MRRADRRRGLWGYRRRGWFRRGRRRRDDEPGRGSRRRVPRPRGRGGRGIVRDCRPRRRGRRKRGSRRRWRGSGGADGGAETRRRRGNFRSGFRRDGGTRREPLRGSEDGRGCGSPAGGRPIPSRSIRLRGRGSFQEIDQGPSPYLFSAIYGTGSKACTLTVHRMGRSPIILWLWWLRRGRSRSYTLAPDCQGEAGRGVVPFWSIGITGESSPGSSCRGGAIGGLSFLLW